MKTLLILGATGLMGRRVASLAERLLPEARLLRAARRVADEPGWRRVDLHDRASLRHGLGGAQAVINAVGPFDYDPAPLIHACEAAGAHYLDLAESVSFIRGARAAASGAVAVVSGCSTVPGLLQALAQRWREQPEVAALRAWLSMGSRNPVTSALLQSLLRPLGRSSPSGERYFTRLQWARDLAGRRRLYGRYPSLFDAEPLRLGAREVTLEFFAGFDRAAYGWLLRGAAPALARLSDGGLAAWCDLATPLLGAARLLGGRTGVLTLEALDGAGTVLGALEVRAEREGLNVPALPSVWAARRLLSEGGGACGAVGLDDLLTAEEVVVGLRAEGIAVECREAE